MSFNKKVITGIRNKSNIVTIIGSFIKLKRSRKNRTDEYAALCPFHNERTPSFTVSETKQIFQCLGCGARGNVVSFIREYMGLNWIESNKKVAELSGYKFPSGNQTPSKKKISDRRKRKERLEHEWQKKMYPKRVVTQLTQQGVDNFDDDIPF